MPLNPPTAKQRFLTALADLGFSLVRDGDQPLVAANPRTTDNPDPQAWMLLNNYSNEIWNRPTWRMEELNQTGQGKYAMAWFMALLQFEDRTTPQIINRWALAATGRPAGGYHYVRVQPAGTIIDGNSLPRAIYAPNPETKMGFGAAGQAVVAGGTEGVPPAHGLPLVISLWFAFPGCNTCPSGLSGMVMLTNNGIEWVGSTQNFCGLPMLFGLLAQPDGRFTLVLTGPLVISGQTQVDAISANLVQLIINWPPVSSFLNGCTATFLANHPA